MQNMRKVDCYLSRLGRAIGILSEVKLEPWRKDPERDKAVEYFLKTGKIPEGWEWDNTNPEGDIVRKGLARAYYAIPPEARRAPSQFSAQLKGKSLSDMAKQWREEKEDEARRKACEKKFGKKCRKLVSLWQPVEA